VKPDQESQTMLPLRKRGPPQRSDPTPDGEHASLGLEQLGRIATQAGDLGREAAALSGTIEDLVATGARQTECVRRVARGMEAIHAADGAIADATQGGHAAVRAAREVAAGVGQGVADMVETLREVSSAADTITRVALQTRLVAFNASVEAKRAGEAGRGFAVVAEAVKDLAAKVEESSKVITRTVAQLDRRIEGLRREIVDGDGAESSLHAALGQVESQVGEIAMAARRNLSTCGSVLESVRALAAEGDAAARSLGQARQQAAGFISVSESLRALTVTSGARKVDTP
jgi:methyl-accepting chemotaxis protein